MALVPDVQYGLSSHGNFDERKSLIFVKLTDSSQRAIKEYLKIKVSAVLAVRRRFLIFFSLHVREARIVVLARARARARRSARARTRVRVRLYVRAVKPIPRGTVACNAPGCARVS